MLDGWLRPRIDPALNVVGRGLAANGVSANAVTAAGLALGLVAAGAVVLQAYGLAAVMLILGRIADGLDGAVARAQGKTALGGYFDIVADFAFYGIFPLAFALQPGNALAAACLLCSFYINGASFLAYAAVAAGQGMETRAQGEKSLYFSAGLMEGAETIAFFLAFCLWPAWFSWIAGGFAALCLWTALGRVRLAARVFARKS